MTYILESPIYRGETHIGYLIKLLQPIQYIKADLFAGYLALFFRMHLADNLTSKLMNLFLRNPSFFTGNLNALAHLLLREALQAAITLYDHDRFKVNVLKGVESLPASDTFLATLDGIVLAIPCLQCFDGVFIAKRT